MECTEFELAMEASKREDRSRSPPRSGAERIPLLGCSSGKRVGVLGGSFDPITNAHLLLASELIQTEVVDEVWLVPCGVRPDKPSLKTPYMHRLMMTHLAVDTTYGSSFPLFVSDMEMSQVKAFKTLDLMEAIQAEYPDKELFCVMGADLYDYHQKWETGERKERFLNKTRFIVYDRPGIELPDKLPDNYKKMVASGSMTLSTQLLSSSEVRLRLDLNRVSKAEGLVPGAVLSHIIRYKLYGDCKK